MAYLVDSNILLRWVQPSDPQNAVAQQAVKELLRQGEQVFVTPQNFIEFWSVATRPENVNGLGRSPADADTDIRQLGQLFPLLPDTPGVYSEWRQIVVTAGVSGVQAHDARLVAVMRVHRVTHILTCNPSDFRRFPEITVVRPQDVTLAPAEPPGDQSTEGQGPRPSAADETSPQ